MATQYNTLEENIIILENFHTEVGFDKEKRDLLIRKKSELKFMLWKAQLLHALKERNR